MRRAVAIPLAVGLVSSALFAIELFIDASHAAFAYLAAFTFAMSTALGSLLILMILRVTGARWFVVLKRLAGASAASLPLFALLFVPICFGLGALYPWARPLEELEPAARAAVLHQGAWMSAPFFVLRAIVYLASFLVVMLVLRRASLANDARFSPRAPAVERLVSGGAMPVLALTLSFAAFDWLMALEPPWSSTMYGVYLFAGALASAFGLLCVAAHLARRAGLLPLEVSESHFHALGRLLLMSVIFWAYIAYCQLLILWLADVPRETIYFGERVAGGWAAASAILGVGHFAAPFLVLLPYRVKRSSTALAILGAWIVAMHAVDAYWLVVPAARSGASPLDLFAFVGMGGLGASFAAWRFFRAPPVPLNDPELAESLRYRSL